jgi:hypothetical protein
MSNLILHREHNNAIALPAPRIAGGNITVREATLKDIDFIDALQRKHARAVGWFPKGQIEGCIKAGNVVIAEACHSRAGGNPEGGQVDHADTGTPLGPRLRGDDGHGIRTPVGYCIAKDKYLKQDQLGICYQLNVVPDKQRGLIGATLLKAVFERSAYGCKLFCCWCAQDLQANHFWESMGFIPLAFRTGSRPRMKKDGTISKPGRIHIFWQRRIREGDTETPYWFPSETSGGAVKENRLVLPIPPGTHWSDAKPAILPGMDEKLLCHSREGGNPADGGGAGSPPARGRREKKPKTVVPMMKPSSIKMGGLRAIPKPPTPEEIAAAKAEKAKPPREKFKNDPKMVAAARELRDRYMEQVNLDPAAMLPPSACGKYDVSRQLEAAPSAMKVAAVVPMLEAA